MQKINIVDDIMCNPTEESRKAKYNFCKENLILFATGGSNWDYFAEVRESGKIWLYSVAKPGSGGSNSYFGDCNHIRNLQRRGHWSGELTDAGRAIMAAY